MTTSRKLLYSACTVAFVFLVIEGTARIVWNRLEAHAFDQRLRAGKEMLRSDAINYMKDADGQYGYVLKRDFSAGGVHINHAGFHQTDEVPVARARGKLRVVCMGESTTFGNAVDSNYPYFLSSILKTYASGYDGYEVINAGVPGWNSEPVALRAEQQLAHYSPDVVILYVGWNDFQSYDPLGPLAPEPYFETAYKRDEWKDYTASWLKSVALLSALYHRNQPSQETASLPVQSITPELRYRFLIASYDRIVAAFTKANPNVRIFLSTVVGLWPLGTSDQWKTIQTIWWMQLHQLSLKESAAYVQKFNDTLRGYVERRRKLTLIDTAYAFESLDRPQLLWDWAHMRSDGYELIAWTMFDAMVDSGVLRRNGPIDRETALRRQYAAPAAVARVATVVQ